MGVGGKKQVVTGGKMFVYEVGGPGGEERGWAGLGWAEHPFHCAGRGTGIGTEALGFTYLERIREYVRYKKTHTHTSQTTIIK